MEKPIGERLAIVEEKHSSFEIWNSRQNGRLNNIDKKLDSIQKWILGIMTSVSLGLLLTIIGFVIK